MTQKTIACIELLMTTTLLVGAVFSLKMIIDGSLIAVVLGPTAALISSVLFEDGDRRIQNLAK